MKKKIYTLKRYSCGYCGCKFQAHVHNEPNERHVSSKGYSTPIKCPYCHNYQKVWEEGENIREDDIRPRDKIQPTIILKGGEKQ